MFSERHQEIFIFLSSSSLSLPLHFLTLSCSYLSLISSTPSPPDSQTVHIFLHVFSVTNTPNNQDFNAIHIAP